MKNCFSHRCHVGIGPRTQLWLSVLVLALVVAGAGTAGYWYGQIRLASAAQGGPHDGTLAALAQTRTNDLAVIKLESSSEIDALSLKLGQMQAEILRLNALGELLVEKAGLSPEEFDFQNTPPQGGPEPHEMLPSSTDEFALEMARLSDQLLDRGRKLRLLEQLTTERELGEGSLAPGLPVRSGYISSYFGTRKDPINGGASFHSGVDYAGKLGSDILAVADGLVVFSDSINGYGRTVEIRHTNGLVTRYAHCKKQLVEVGDLVTKGQVIATLGNSGRSTGPHLHFEVLRDGVAMNPLLLAGLDLPK
ncbi:MAG: M23 family metallopeptidase [Chromatiaceae bacterium]